MFWSLVAYLISLKVDWQLAKTPSLLLWYFESSRFFRVPLRRSELVCSDLLFPQMCLELFVSFSWIPEQHCYWRQPARQRFQDLSLISGLEW